MPSPFPAPNWLEKALKQYRRKLDHVRLTKKVHGLETRVPLNIWQTAAVAQVQLQQTLDKVRYILDQEGVFADIRPSYHAYALALEKSQKEMTWMVDLVREHQILRDRWGRRGLDSDILNKIDALIIIHVQP